MYISYLLQSNDEDMKRIKNVYFIILDLTEDGINALLGSLEPNIDNNTLEMLHIAALTVEICTSLFFCPLFFDC
jgi:hypothetical protein